MAYSDNFPSQRPSFMFDASNAGRIPPNMTFSRSDSPIDATKAAASAVHYWSNEKSLSSENLLLQSSDFDTTWSHTGINGTPTGGQADPAGGTDGFTLVEDSANNFHRIWQAVTASGDFAFTVYAKQNSGTRYLSLSLYNASSDWVGATFDLAGSAPTTSSGSSSSFSGLTATQTASGGGFYKCTIKATGSLTSAQAVLNNVTSAPTGGYGLPSYTGDGTSSIDVAFASLSTTGATDYNATTTSIHRQYASTLKSVSTAGQPRFEYGIDGQSGGTSLGILVESQSTNYLAGSATIGGTYWGVANATAQQNSAVAPDGTLTATTLVENSAGGAKYAYSNNYTPAASTTYTFSVFVKPNGRNFCMIYTNLGGAGQSSMFDLVTGSTSNLSGSGTNQANQCGNGWWRLSVTVTTTSTTAANFQILTASDATTIDYTGNGYSGLLCWGAMLEQSSHASSYIGTTTTAVTRAADSLSVATADIGYTGGPFTIVSETEGGKGYYPMAWALSDESDSNRVYVYRNSSSASDSTNWYLESRSDGASVASAFISSSASAGKLAVSYDTNDVSSCASGGTVTTDTAASLPASASELQIGAHWNGNNPLNGHVKRIALYGEALSDSNLQAITS
jgi:hypothetical protein